MVAKGVYLGFDFGYRRIGVAVGQSITKTARPLKTCLAEAGIPQWQALDALVNTWRPEAMIIGLPTKMDGSKQYTTQAAQVFAESLKKRFNIPVYLVDERLTTVAARSELFKVGGYQKIKKTEIDCVAACLILEQWMTTHESSDGLS